MVPLLIVMCKRIEIVEFRDILKCYLIKIHKNENVNEKKNFWHLVSLIMKNEECFRRFFLFRRRRRRCLDDVIMNNNIK